MSKHRSITLLAVVLISMILSIKVNAGLIVAVSDSNIQNNTTLFNNAFGGDDVYGRLGVTKTWASLNWSGSITAAANNYSNGATVVASDLIGIEWVIAGSATPWTAAELTLLSSFASSGGNIWVVGEYGPLHADISASGNALLASLGSLMSFDSSANFGNDAANISAHVLTAGVTLWDGAAAGRIIGGHALATDNGGDVFLAYENVGINPNPIPEPATLVLMGLGLAGIGFRRKRNAG